MDSLQNLANAIRFLAIDMVEEAKSGHPGMPMGMADVVTVLVRDFLKFIPEDPWWPNRDRLILSAGHGSALLYAVLYLTGYEEMTLTELKRFRKLGSKTAGHPEYGHAAGIETTTGPLGQGLANAVGMALAERMLNADYGDKLVHHKIYAIVGDGCLMEGISQEAISLAGHLSLPNLIVLFDDNGISIDGSTSLATSENQLTRFTASGWEVRHISGHNYVEIHDALAWAQAANKPVLIACKTDIAHGAPTKAGHHEAHGAPLGPEEVARTRAHLSWPFPQFVIPEPILQGWRSFKNRNSSAYTQWQKNIRHDAKGHTLKARLQQTHEDLIAAITPALLALKQELSLNPITEATRRSSHRILTCISPLIPALVGGSADLTPSNNTHVIDQTVIAPHEYSGRYIHYGVREHGMAAIMNGIALYKGFIPYGGTFLVFSDYMRPAIRLAALMHQQVIYVMTHDSIGLGEDGPTHQPIEHLASLRAIPHLRVFRPCDAVETLEAWEMALAYNGPSILALTRQNVPSMRTQFTPTNMVSYGAYILHPTTPAIPDIIIFASGSEVHIACKAAEILEKQPLLVRIVSVPELHLFAAQSPEYKHTVLQHKEAGIKVVIEAARTLGWQDIIGPVHLVIGLDDFGASATQEELYQHFALTPEAVAARIQEVATLTKTAQ